MSFEIDCNNLLYAKAGRFEEMICIKCNHKCCPCCAAQVDFWCDNIGCIDSDDESCETCDYGQQTNDYLNKLCEQVEAIHKPTMV